MGDDKSGLAVMSFILVFALTVLAFTFSVRSEWIQLLWGIYFAGMIAFVLYTELV